MRIEAPDDLLTLETRVRQDGAAGLWHETALHTIRHETPWGEGYGRDDLVVAAHSRQSADTRLRDGWAFGADGLFAWSARLEGTNRGTGRSFQGLAGGVARVVRGRVASLFTVEDTLATAPGDPAAEAARRRAETAPPLVGADFHMSQLPPEETDLRALPDPARRLLSALNRRRPDELDGLYAPDCATELCGGRRLEGGALPYWRDWLAALPDAVALPELAVADGDRLALLWHLKGTHRGPGLTSEPTGRRLSVPILWQARLEGGLIAAERVLLDEVAALAALA
ncbi:MAG TPA: ester cyclase [Azospirillaceae bacterium]|nr:ester cyclase [Azospirillaceae bacterium]